VLTHTSRASNHALTFRPAHVCLFCLLRARHVCVPVGGGGKAALSKGFGGKPVPRSLRRKRTRLPSRCGVASPPLFSRARVFCLNCVKSATCPSHHTTSHHVRSCGKAVGAGGCVGGWVRGRVHRVMCCFSRCASMSLAFGEANTRTRSFVRFGGRSAFLRPRFVRTGPGLCGTCVLSVL